MISGNGTEKLFTTRFEILGPGVKYFHSDYDLFHGVKYFTVAVNFSRCKREISLTFQ